MGTLDDDEELRTKVIQKIVELYRNLYETATGEFGGYEPFDSMIDHPPEQVSKRWFTFLLLLNLLRLFDLWCRICLGKKTQKKALASKVFALVPAGVTILSIMATVADASDRFQGDHECLGCP